MATFLFVLNVFVSVVTVLVASVVARTHRSYLFVTLRTDRNWGRMARNKMSRKRRSNINRLTKVFHLDLTDVSRSAFESIRCFVYGEVSTYNGASLVGVGF
jgi:hypothetical protein